MKATLKKYENYQYPDKFGELLGYRMLRIFKKKGRVQVGLKIREEHLSMAGRVHGGVISAFFDFACGAAAFTTLGLKDFCSTVELKVNYLKPLNLGDNLTAGAQVIFRGKRLCVVQAQLHRRGDRSPVAIASSTFYVVSERTGSLYLLKGTKKKI